MKFILQMIVDESAWLSLSPEEMQPMIETMDRFNDELRAAGAWVSGEGLDYSGNARTVRISDGQRRVESGPYSPGAVQLAGLWIIDAPSLDDAVDWARRVPLTNGAVEVRSLVPDE